MRKFIEYFFQTYLGKRDWEETISFFTDDVIYIGTGRHEIAIGKKAVSELLQEEVRELPLPFQYDMYDYTEKEAAENRKDVFANFKVVMLWEENRTELSARFTGSCIKNNGEWKISCMHMSSASAEQKDGEFFPLMYGTAVTGKLSAASENELMKLASTSLPGGIMGRYLEEGFPLYTINDKMLDILGYTYDELLAESGEKVANLIFEEDRERVKNWAYHQLKRNEQSEIEYRLISKGGHLVWVNDIGRRIVGDSGKEVIISIISDVTQKVQERLEEQNMQQKMKVLAYTDALTGLGNRTKFNEKLQQCTQAEIFACIVADINNLKFCNEKYGHSEGDAMIVDVAQAIEAVYKNLGDCYRIGGDEFCVLIPQSEKEEILRTLEQVKAYMEVQNREREIPLSVAFGYAIQESAEERVKELFNRSAEMMHDVKCRMKNGFSVYREEKITNYLNVLKFFKKITDNYFFLWDIPRDEFWFLDDIDKEYAVHMNEKPTIASKETERFVYPADYPMLVDDLDRIEKGLQKEHNLNYRWINKKGEIVWINCYGQTIADDEGKPFCMIGRVSDQVLRHLYHPVTKLFNKEKLLQDFAQGLVSDGYLMLLSVDNPDAGNLKNSSGSETQTVRKCAEVLENSGVTRYLWHTEENCFALYMEADTEKEIREKYNVLLKELEGICTVSAGVVPDNEEMFEYKQDLYTCAKLTLEKAQTIGKNALLFFVKEDMKKQEKTVRLLAELQNSIENGCEGFYLNYQPLVKSGNYQIYGAEALLRYHSETMGEVYPDEFIPLLEETKLINKAGLWILETALKQCRYWRKWLPEFHINVNFSVVQLSEHDIAQKVLDILEKTGMTGDALTIELTENIQIHDTAYLNEIFGRWREAGVELSIDDFGTGYASMGYLNELNVAEIKIDRIFVARIGEATYNYKLISSVIDFAKNTNIRIICEGVEDMRELVVLEQLAPNLIQGYLFAKPCDKELFERSFINPQTIEYQMYVEQIQEIYQYKNRMNVVHFDAKDILRETEVGLWIIRINETEQYYEMYADETMEHVLGVDRKYTPAECYQFWLSRIKPEYVDYVTENVMHIIESDKVVQLQYPWMHPKLGEVIVRCSGKRLENSDGMVALNGYHRILSTIEETAK